MFDTIYDLPIHALVVHGVVVLVPLAAAGVLLLCVRPGLRGTNVGWSVAGLAVVGAALAFVARQSGLELEKRVGAGARGVIAEQIADHKSFGILTVWYALAMAVAAVALVVSARRKVSRTVGAVIVAVAVVTAGSAAVQVVLTGHSGSVAVWKCTIVPEECSG